MTKGIRLCRRCGRTIGRYKQLCDECKVDSQKEVIKRKSAKARFKFKTTHEYKYNKNHGLEQPKKDLKKLSPATQRWAKMSWYDLMAECEKYGISYKDSQLMAKNGTLPEDFGLGCKL